MNLAALGAQLHALNRRLNQAFPLLALLLAVLSFYQPTLLRWVLPHIALFLSLIMFGMGMTLAPRDFLVLKQRPGAVLLGVVAQFVLMPLSAYALTLLLPLPPEIALGVILVGSCPGGTASNVITYLARGNVALSVAVTALSTLLAPLLTPLIFHLFAQQHLELSLPAMMKSIMNIVFWPVLAGFTLNFLFPRTVKRFEPVFPLFSMVFIILIIGAVVGNSRAAIVQSGLLIFTAVVLHNALGLALGLMTARYFGLPWDMQKTLAIEVGMQNSGLAVKLAQVHLALFPAAAVPGALFSLWHNISGGFLASRWAVLAERSASGSASPQ